MFCLSFTTPQLLVIRAIHFKFASPLEINQASNIPLHKICRTLNSLKKWNFVDYVVCDERYSNGIRVRKWFLTDSFYKIYGSLL